MADEVERRLRSYARDHFRELEHAIKTHNQIGWPERGEELRRWRIGLTYPYPSTTTGVRAVNAVWTPSDRIISAFQALFGRHSFSVEVHLDGPNIVDIIERR